MTTVIGILIITLGFALGIIRVQYRFFIGTAAKRSPEKPDPYVAWGTPKSVFRWMFSVAISLWFSAFLPNMTSRLN
ncbi:hypothetical protein ACFOG5_18600 [Pedobacter fastidiosus]|uniref:hypothetical protein n=1 Tax=Pedobacter fastidiosus TaxID=2765361 RepID=UPI00164E2F4D